MMGTAGAVLVESNTDSESVADAPTTGEGPSTAAQGATEPRVLEIALPDKLSIYTKSTSGLVLLDSPSPLELKIGKVRRELCGYYTGARAHVQGVLDRWIRVENNVESRIKSFRDPIEPLNPALLYTGISALTASIFARSSSLPTRFLLPPLSFLGAFVYFLPRTASRVGSYAEELEDRYVPKLGEVRRTGIAHGKMALERLGESARDGKGALEKGAGSIVGAIESSTGLKLGDVFGDREQSRGSRKDKS
ncbi:apolipo protein O-domain-containing protein [Scleroderma citrinum]